MKSKFKTEVEENYLLKIAVVPTGNAAFILGKGFKWHSAGTNIPDNITPNI